MGGEKPTLYQAWFCPFAQRAWIALLAKGVDFTLVEQDPYNKSKEWMTICPTGMVPAIVHNDRSVYESAVCIEYVDEAFEGPALFPTDPYERARARIIADQIGKHIIPHIYYLLMKPGQEDRDAASKAILDNLLKVTKEMHPTGPFFLGSEFGFLDIILYPHAQRFYLLEHYRDFRVPENGGYEKFHRWFKACNQLECCSKTVADRQQLIDKYLRYANDTAQTLTAEAVRKGAVLP